jgi:hypothetical protein
LSILKRAIGALVLVAVVQQGRIAAAHGIAFYQRYLMITLADNDGSGSTSLSFSRVPT